MNIICYSKSGYELAKKLEESLASIKVYSKYRKAFKGQEVVRDSFDNKEDLIFISATGIAVRTIAPYLKGKDQDPAILVIDDHGKFVISLCSGHLGGANDLARKIAGILGATPVITTATDNRGYEGLDLYAKRMGFNYSSIQDLTPLTGAMVDDQPIYLYNPYGIARPNYPNFIDDYDQSTKFTLAITDAQAITRPGYTVYLRPRILHLGLGCKKNAKFKDLMTLLTKVFKDNNLSLDSVKDMASIDIKKDEDAFLELSEKLNIPFRTYSASELSQYEKNVIGSEFVKKTVGVSSVSATAALIQGGELIVEKERDNGFTVSISKEI